MSYVYEYDIVAIVFTFIIIITFLRNKTIETSITKIFTILITDVIIADVFDLDPSRAFLENHQPEFQPSRACLYDAGALDPRCGDHRRRFERLREKHRENLYGTRGQVCF